MPVSSSISTFQNTHSTEWMWRAADCLARADYGACRFRLKRKYKSTRTADPPRPFQSESGVRIGSPDPDDFQNLTRTSMSKDMSRLTFSYIRIDLRIRLIYGLTAQT